MNCSTCHRNLGGGTATFTFDITVALEESEYLDALPFQGSFGINDARVVAPGDPFRSVLLYRTLKSGRGHMPQFGSNVLDREGIQLLHDWIATMDAGGKQPSTQEAIGRTSTAARISRSVGLRLCWRRIRSSKVWIPKLVCSTPCC